MTRCKWLTAALWATAAAVAISGAAFGAETTGKIRVAVVTGGHGFDSKAFFALFEGYPDVAYTHVAQKTGGELLAKIDDFPYDVMVFYNFNQKATDQERANFLKLLDRGVGLIVLHHAGAAYPAWPEFGRIAGGCFHMGAREEDGVKKPGSGVKFNVTYQVQVADREHPITKGLEDFTVTDETYIRCTIQPDLHPLLITDEPSSDKVVGGVRTERKSRVFYTQLGHDGKVYGHPTYRKLIIRAVRWVAGRPVEP